MKTTTLGIINPEGKLLTTTQFFTNRKDAVRFALKTAGIKSRKSERDGSNLDWKAMKREGWAILPVRHVVAS